MAGGGADLRVTVLGQVGAVLDGAPLDLGGRRQRSVLAMIVMARGEAVSADRIIDSLWGEEPPATASGALQAFVSHLRRRLEPGRAARSKASVIVSAGPGYALQLGRDAVDAWRFEDLLLAAPSREDPVTTLAEALGLWRGPAYAEYQDEPWAQAEMARLSELREVAREQVLAARLTRGEDAVLVPELEQLVAEAPLREERWRLLALGLYRANRQADALAALRRARETLADEVGVEPGPALRQLEHEVLHQAPSLRPALPAAAAPAQGSGRVAPTVPTPALPGPRPAVPRPVVDADLVDRADELSELSAMVAGLQAGEGGFLLIEGPAGIGKTRLLVQARQLAARDGVPVLAARGSLLEKEYGFGVVRQLFEPQLVDPEESAALLAGAAAGAAPVFDLTSEFPQGTLALMHGLYWLTMNLAGRGPVVLTIDDIQWSDTGSLRFFAYLVRRLESMPLLVVATMRTGEPHEDEALLAELAHDPATVSMRPGPLSRDGVAELVRQRLGADADLAFVRACHRSTSGNPLLLRQMLRALQAESVRPDAAHARTVTEIGARAVSGLVLSRLRRMPDACTAAARAVAVLGDGAALPSVATLASLGEDRAATVIATLARAEVLRDDYPLGFVHPLVADAVYRDLPTGERQMHHERAARILREENASAERIAAQLLHAPHRGEAWVVEALRAAARVASARGVPDAAVRYLERALAEPPEADERSTILTELGRLETHTNGMAAVEHLREAYASERDPARRAEVAQMLARTLVFVGAPGEATAFAHQALPELTGEPVDARQALLALARIGGFMHDIDPVVWRVGTPRVEGEGHGARALAAVLAWELVVDGSDRERAVELARFALAGDVLVEWDPGLLWTVAAIALELSGEDVMPVWDEMLALAHRRGAIFGALSVHLWRGFTEWQRGELRAAAESFVISNEQSYAWGSNLGIPYSDAFQVNILVEQGNFEAARALVEQARPVRRHGDSDRLFAEAEVRVLLGEGRCHEAIAVLDRARRVLKVIRNPAWRRHHELRALALAELGRTTEAEHLLREEIDKARAWGLPAVTGRLLRTLGSILGVAGLAQLREAVGLLAGSPARLEHARAVAALAAHEPEPRELLVEAYRIAHRCGAHGLVRDIAEQLAAIGEQPPAVAPGEDLTRMERHLVELAADGADEVSIAQALLLTPQVVRDRLVALRERQSVGGQ